MTYARTFDALQLAASAKHVATPVSEMQFSHTTKAMSAAFGDPKLRSFRFGHDCQVDAVAARFLAQGPKHTNLPGADASTNPRLVFVDVDSTVVAVHGFFSSIRWCEDGPRGS